MFLQLDSYLFLLTQTSLEFLATLPTNFSNSVLVLHGDVFCTNGQSIFQFNSRLKQFQKISLNQGVKFFQFGDTCLQWKIGQKIELIKKDYRAELLVKTNLVEIAFIGGGTLILKDFDNCLIVDIVNCKCVHREIKTPLKIVKSFCGVSLEDSMLEELLGADFLQKRREFHQKFLQKRT